MAVIDGRTPLSLAETLGAVLAAVVDAQRQAARASIEFIEDVGLVEAGEDEAAGRALRTVAIRYSKLDENFERRTFELEVPLLSLVNVPMVSVKEARVTFDWEVVESGAAPERAAPSAPRPVRPSPRVATAARLEALPKAASLRGRVVRPAPTATASSTAGAEAKEQRTRSGMEVTVTLDRSEPPAGLDRLLDTLELAAADEPSPDES